MLISQDILPNPLLLNKLNYYGLFGILLLMSKQSGFSSLILIAVLAFMGLGLFIGLDVQKNAVLNDQKHKNSEASASASLEATPSASVSASVSATPKDSTSSKDTSASKSDQNKVTISGKYTIPEFNKIWYTITFPKQGGDFSGSISGFCNGNISGHVDSPDPDQESKFTGTLDAKCTPYVGLSFNPTMKADLEGLVEFKTGKVKVTAAFSQPYETRIYTELNFTP